MGRMVSLTNPASVTSSKTFDGNGNITKTDDFKGTVHYYKYDSLNRMTGHGTTSAATDETYTWACCSEMTAYTDAQGTATRTYNDLSQLTSFTDTNGNQVQYEYDEMGRQTKVTPPQGSRYRTEYEYNYKGSLTTVKVYENDIAADTTYTYSTSTGKLTRRDFPEESSRNIRTTYSYDSAGRLEYETVTQETASSSNRSQAGRLRHRFPSFNTLLPSFSPRLPTPRILQLE